MSGNEATEEDCRRAARRGLIIVNIEEITDGGDGMQGKD
jgi:hypothetical protein